MSKRTRRTTEYWAFRESRRENLTNRIEAKYRAPEGEAPYVLVGLEVLNVGQRSERQPTCVERGVHAGSCEGQGGEAEI